MAKKNLPIPQFDLYDEQTLYDNPGFVHIEDIADRSQRNDWVIKPHRHGKMLQILVIYTGNTRVEIDDDQYDFNGGRIVTIPPGAVHGFRFQPGTSGRVLTIAEPVFTSARFTVCKAYFEPVINQSTIIELHSNSVLFNQVDHYLEQIESELVKHEMGQELMLEWTLSMLMMTLRRQLEFEYAGFQTLSGSANRQMMDRFRALLEEHFREQWSVKDYANALHTSYSTLNRFCKETASLSAKDIILNRMVVAAKRQLIYTQAPLDQIAHKLGFKDPAYFSRIFKKKVSMSPNAYRKMKFEESRTVQE